MAEDEVVGDGSAGRVGILVRAALALAVLSAVLVVVFGALIVRTDGQVDKVRRDLDSQRGEQYRIGGQMDSR